MNEADREARAIEFYQLLSSFDYMAWKGARAKVNWDMIRLNQIKKIPYCSKKFVIKEEMSFKV